MPPRIPKVCRAAGCSSLTIERNGYCLAHTTMAIGWHDTNKAKGNADERGYGYAWRRIRSIVMKRDNYLCKPCSLKGIATPATAVDHITNKADGGTDELSNLQAICDQCHDIKTLAEAAAGRNRRSIRG